MLANFLIGIREGLEAALIVGILVSFAQRFDRRDVVVRIGWGVAAAVVVALGVGALLFTVLSEASDTVEPIIAGVLSVVAAALLTWMIFWMARRSGSLKGSLESSLSTGMSRSGLGVVVIAFTAVVREGVETALFIWASVSSTGDGLVDLAFAVLGILIAVALGWLVHRGLARINLRRFFLWTSAALIVVAAGILAYGIAELAEVGWLPETAVLVDMSSWLGEETVIGSFLTGLIAFHATPTLLEAIVWVAYVVPTLGAFVSITAANRTPSSARR